MNVKRVTLIALGLIGGAGVWWWYGQRSPGAVLYRTAAVERGDVRASVSATGTLSAVRTVEVGTQVSGQVAELFVDYNDRVRRGQLIARIDPILQQQAVQDAEAGVTRAEAQLAQATDDFERTAALHAGKIVTETEFATARTTRTLAASNLASAHIALERARQNLAYTNIYAPIDGVVIERAIDVGQTVAASLSAPRLFVIANDLRRMQIMTAVDEGDIGRIARGQRAEFTVQAYAARRFEGRVEQVRLASTTANNVVSYTVVVSVDNPDGALLPGMTATVQFITDEATDVLTVPNAALRFRPAGADSVSGAPRRAPAERGRLGVVYTLRGDSIAPLRVRVGLTDGTRTVVAGDGLSPGLVVVIGVSTAGDGASAAAPNPFQAAPGATRRTGPRTPF